MFKKKPVIKVIGVKSEKREIETIGRTGYGFSGGYTDESKTEKKYVTIVLFTKDGELGTREFNGKWDIDDIKTWEEL